MHYLTCIVCQFRTPSVDTLDMENFYENIIKLTHIIQKDQIHPRELVK